MSAAEPNFARDIRPILSDKCYNCHGPDKKARKGKLRLHDRAGVMESRVLSDGELLARLTSDDPDEGTPPAGLHNLRTGEHSEQRSIGQFDGLRLHKPIGHRHIVSQHHFRTPALPQVGCKPRSNTKGRSEPALVQGMRVLVVDDHAINRKILEEILKSWEMRVELAEDGFAALAALWRPRDRSTTRRVAGAKKDAAILAAVWMRCVARVARLARLAWLAWVQPRYHAQAQARARTSRCRR